MISDRQESARMQSDFYRDRYRSLLNALIVSLCIMVILIAVVISLALTRKPIKYYATTTQGQVVLLTPVSNK